MRFTVFLGFAHGLTSKEYWVTRRRELLRFADVKKNGLLNLR
jgi:hypothetical protein